MITLLHPPGLFHLTSKSVSLTPAQSSPIIVQLADHTERVSLIRLARGLAGIINLVRRAEWRICICNLNGIYTLATTE